MSERLSRLKEVEREEKVKEWNERVISRLEENKGRKFTFEGIEGIANEDIF